MSDQDKVLLEFQQGIKSGSDTWYNTLQFLGKGGNATTYLMVAGEGSHQGTPFAVKIFHRLSKPERRDSFLQEVRFLHECQHPGILRVYDEGTYRDNHPFVVAEYLPQTLADVLRGRRANLIEKLSFAIQLLSSLEFLSSLSPQVIHRDIKPQNIFVKGRSCVLGDFGLMKRLEVDIYESPEEVVKNSVGPGMPFFYRTPDLVRYARGEESLTASSDVYQLALVLAQMFAGRNPQKRAENDQPLSDVELESIGYIPGAFRSQIKSLIDSMLESDPSSRVTVSDALPAWRGLFFEAAEQVNAIEGRVFS